MSDSIAAVVASLKKVRSEFETSLKLVPQYAGFLEVDSLIGNVQTALGVSDTQEGSDAAKAVVQSLQNAKTQYLSLLESVKEYSALQSIDKLIANLDASIEVTQPDAEPVAEVEAEPEIATDGIATIETDPHDTDRKVAAALGDFEDASEHNAPQQQTIETASSAETHVAETVAPVTAGQPQSSGFLWQAPEPQPTVVDAAPPASGEQPGPADGTERAA